MAETNTNANEFFVSRFRGCACGLLGVSSPFLWAFNSPWLLALLYSALLFDGNMNLSPYKGTDPWAVFFAAERDTFPNVNFVWKNNVAGGVLKRDKMNGMSESEDESSSSLQQKLPGLRWAENWSSWSGTDNALW